MSRYLLTGMVLCLSSLNNNTQATEIYADALVFYEDQSNISRAEADGDRFGDAFMGAGFVIGRAIVADQSGTLSGELSGQYLHHDFYEPLNHIDLSVALKWRKKAGLGINAPVYGASIQWMKKNHTNDVRDASVLSLDGFWQKRWQSLWDISFVISAELMAADETSIASGGVAVGPSPGPSPGVSALPGDSFDQHQVAFGVFSGYELSAIHLLTAGLLIAHGEIASTATPDAKIIAAANAITDDFVFGPNRFAYKLWALTYSLSVDWNIAVGDNGSLSLGAQMDWVDAEADIEYNNQKLRLEFIYQF